MLSAWKYLLSGKFDGQCLIFPHKWLLHQPGTLFPGGLVYPRQLVHCYGSLSESQPIRLELPIFGQCLPVLCALNSQLTACGQSVTCHQKHETDKT